MSNLKGPQSTEQQSITDAPIGKNYIFAIANNDYPNSPLNNCIRDAEAFIDLLLKKYQFKTAEVRFLQDANRKAMLDAFHEYANIITPEDNIIIYYSGHGVYDEKLNEGSWVPAKTTFADTDEFISNADLKVRLNAIKSHHTFLIVDACYSGSLFLSTTKGTSSYLEKFPSRWGLVSGRLQTVSDGQKGKHSPFAEALLYHLENNDNPLTVMDLCIRVVEQVGANQAGQMPIGEPLQVEGHKSGQFVFHMKNASNNTAAKAVEDTTSVPSRSMSESQPSEINKPKIAFNYERAMQLFTQNNIETIFKMLNDYAVQTNNIEVQTTTVMLQNRFNTLKKEDMLGTLSYQEVSRDRNNINSDLLKLLNLLK